MNLSIIKSIAMETVKDNNHKYKYATLCKCCNGTGEYVRRY